MAKGVTTKYCKYDCDYMCAMCLDEERKAGTQTNQSPLGPTWGGYPFYEDDACDTGVYVPTPIHSTTTSYVPPPFKELQLRRIIEPQAIEIVGPDSLKKRSIVI